MRHFVVLFSLICLVQSLPSSALTPPERTLIPEYCNEDGSLALLSSKSLGDHAANGVLGEHIRLLSWNVQKATHPEFEAELQTLTPDVDLVLLQEADVGLRASPSLRDYHGSFAEGYRAASQVTGVLTLSHAAPAKHCRLSHNEPWLRTPKATSVAVFNLDKDRHLLVINLHAVNFTLGTEDLAVQLESSAALIEQHTGPVIFAGDFNTWNAPRKALFKRTILGLGLESVEFDEDHRTRVMGYALDHVLVRGLHIVESQSLSVQSSDHNPVLVTLSVRDA